MISTTPVTETPTTKTLQPTHDNHTQLATPLAHLRALEPPTVHTYGGGTRSQGRRTVVLVGLHITVQQDHITRAAGISAHLDSVLTARARVARGVVTPLLATRTTPATSH